MGRHSGPSRLVTRGLDAVRRPGPLTDALCPPVSPGLELIAAFYGCLYCGCVPVTVRPPHPQNLATTLPTVKMIVEVGGQRGPRGGPDRGPACGLLPGAASRACLQPLCSAGQHVRVRPHHAGHHAAAQVQGSGGHCGRQDLADHSRHRCVSSGWCACCPPARAPCPPSSWGCVPGTQN